MRILCYYISDENCKEISIDVDLSYKLFEKLFLPKNLKRVTKDELENNGYKVEIEDGGIFNRYIIVYKNDKLIHKEENKTNINCDTRILRKIHSNHW